MAIEQEDDTVVAKVTSMVVLGGAAFVVTLLPVFISKRLSSAKRQEVQHRNSNTDLILSLFLSFGGGVLLCTTFLHLLPEVTESIETLKEKGRIPKDFPLPLPELVMCCGFFTMYIVEEVVHKVLHSRQLKKAKKGRDNPLNVSSTVLVDTEMTVAETYKEILEQHKFQVGFTPESDEGKSIIPTPPKNYSTCSHSSPEVNHNDQHCDHDHQPRDHHHDHQHHHHHHDSADHHVVVTEDLPSLRELLIVLALTVHEGFEGLAIGLESSVAAVWYLLTAVAVHKCVIAFCIGIELVSGHVSLWLSVFYAFIYSCASPFGIGIGLLLSEAREDDHLTALLSVILQGMATGTLLYVVFFEILRRDGHQSGLAQMIVVILGFTCMGALTVFINA